MKIGIICNDTRGGVEPYVALALHLRARGHAVRAVAPAGLSAMFADRGFTVATLAGTEDAARFAAAGIAEQGTLAAMRLMRSEMPRRLEHWTRSIIAACEGCDMLTGGIGGMATGLVAAQVLRLPWLPTQLQPLGRPTARYPGALFPGTPRWLGAPGRLMSHWLTDTAAWLPFRAAVSQVRRTFGMTRAPNPVTGLPAVYGFSRHVVPLPEDRNHIVSGYWRLPLAETAPLGADLTAFLDHPGPVVGIGFGSMGSADPRALAALMAAAVRRAGVRAVLLGDGFSAAPSSDVIAATNVPHARLFPRLSAIVHHGGAGTTGAAFGAGKPQVVVPFAVDQPFWGSRVFALGCGPAPIRRRDLNQDRLAQALTAAVATPSYAVNAAQVADLIKTESGCDRAADVFESFGSQRRV